MEMLEVRAALEERLKQEGILSSRASKSDKAKKRLKPVNGPLVTYDDFDDDAVDVGATRFSNGHASSLKQVVSGDDDLPKRDDIGERRRKHELRVLVGAESNLRMMLGRMMLWMKLTILRSMGMLTWGMVIQEIQKMKRAAKLAAKADVYSRTSAVVPSSPEPIDGKCYITYEMEKNRGLTWNRKNQTKNPRKKYKEQHKKKVNHRKGQVQEIKKPVGPYGGEASGINVATSRSVRFKN